MGLGFVLIFLAFWAIEASIEFLPSRPIYAAAIIVLAALFFGIPLLRILSSESIRDSFWFKLMSLECQLFSIVALVELLILGVATVFAVAVEGVAMPLWVPFAIAGISTALVLISQETIRFCFFGVDDAHPRAAGSGRGR